MAGYFEKQNFVQKTQLVSPHLSYYSEKSLWAKNGKNSGLKIKQFSKISLIPQGSFGTIIQLRKEIEKKNYSVNKRN